MKNTNTPTFIAIVFAIGFFLIFTLYIKQKENSLAYKNENSIISLNNSENLPTSMVPKGTFKNLETGDIFEYIDGSGYLVSCGLSNCKTVYFDMRDDGSIIQIRHSGESPIIGKIVNVDFSEKDNEHSSYSIEYLANNGDRLKSGYIDDLCSHFKGGGVSCRAPARIGQTVIIDFDSEDINKIAYITLFNRMLKADVVDVVSVNHDELSNSD